MPNDYFEFKQFIVKQSDCSQKVSTDACLFGAWVATHVGRTQQVVDLGAGTGLLMLMLAQKHEAEITGIEIEETCAKQANANIESSPWGKRLSVIHADARTLQYEKKYDLVLSNPPFYENQLQSPDHSKNLAWHSNELSLAELTVIASNVLSVEGFFCILLPHSRKEEALEAVAKYSLHAKRILTVRHTRKHEASRCMLIFSKLKTDTLEESLEIRNEDGSYTSTFVELLKDYYLFL